MSDSAPTLFPLSPDHFPMIVHDAPVRDAAIMDHIRARWQVMQAANSRLFDGPLLTLRHLDRSSGTLAVQRDSYMPYAVQPEVNTGVTSIGVTAVIRAQDHVGVWRYFCGQRANTTHIYPGLWELGPSGGMQPSASELLSLSNVRQQLQVEIAEEIGIRITLDDSNSEPLCIVSDQDAHSIDLAMTLALKEIPRIERSWEYQACAWVSLAEFAEWETSHPVIASSWAIIQWISSHC